MKLDKSVAVVTGGAKGIGKGIVQVFLKYGAMVVILDHSLELKDTVIELNKSYPGKINGYTVDITDQKVLDVCFSEIKNTYGTIDIIVNNAGVCKLDSFLTMSNEKRDLHFNVNIMGTWLVTHTFYLF